MNNKNIKLFTFFGLFWIGLGWTALVLALLGLFYIQIILFLAILAGLFLIYQVVKSKEKISLNWEIWGVILISLATVFLFSRYSVPTVFSGRDQGSLANAAISLSKNHRIQSSFNAEKEFFKIYGPGTALNFPGFSYDQSGNLTPHFPLGYISWLAIFYSLFGLAGLIVANGITFFLFLISFYFLSRIYLEKSPAFMALFLVLTSFIFSWFFKFTLGENLALALVWFGIFQFVFFLKKRDNLYLLAFLLTFGLLVFVRLEALAFGFIATLLLLWQYKSWKQIWQKLLEKKIFFTSLAMLFIFILSLKINQAFYIAFMKGFLNSFHFYKNNLVGSHHLLEGTSYVFRVLTAYALLSYLIIGFIGFIYFLKNKKTSWLFPYLALSPALIYVFNPSISLDHPWMLRRYVFAVIPLSILYTVLFLDAFFKKRKAYLYLFLFSLLLTNLTIFFPYLSIRQNKGLLSPIKSLSANFKKNDLVLVDRNATGNPWAMMDGPLHSLYGKQAVYFFNPQDLSKINLTKFNQIYFIIPDNNLEFYKKNGLGAKLFPVKDYTLEISSLNVTAKTKNELYKTPVYLPQYQKKYIYGEIYALRK